MKRHWTSLRIVWPAPEGSTEMPSHDSVPVAIHNVSLTPSVTPMERASTMVRQFGILYGFKPPKLLFGGH